jgi:hypothetical protein
MDVAFDFMYVRLVLFLNIVEEGAIFKILGAPMIL